MLTPWEMLVFGGIACSMVWAFLALLILGRTLQLSWGKLAALAIVPNVTLFYFVVAGFSGMYDPFFGQEEVFVPVAMAMIFLPYPILLTLMIRAARRMQMSDGRVVAEVFR